MWGFGLVEAPYPRVSALCSVHPLKMGRLRWLGSWDWIAEGDTWRDGSAYELFLFSSDALGVTEDTRSLTHSLTHSWVPKKTVVSWKPKPQAKQ